MRTLIYPGFFPYGTWSDETKRVANMQSKSKTNEKIEDDETGNDWMKLLLEINSNFLILGKIELLLSGEAYSSYE